MAAGKEITRPVIPPMTDEHRRDAPMETNNPVKLRSVSPVELPSAERPTLEGLLKHADKYGLDIDAKNVGLSKFAKPKKHKTYRTLKKDALVRVGFDYLGVKSYRLLIEGIGYPELADDAEKDWRSARGN